jgi:ATP-binding cassette subfamily F protein uup
MILDEPTNDLDLETLDLLQDMLGEYKGTVLLVSHDRDFLDRVVTSTVASEGDGRWQDYAGGYSDMLAQRGEVAAVTRTGAKARTPSASVAAPASARKMSFKEQHELKTLSADIGSLQARIAAHHRVLADAGLFTRDKKRFDTVSGRLAEDGRALAIAEERWLTLELLREGSMSPQ